MPVANLRSASTVPLPHDTMLLRPLLGSIAAVMLTAGPALAQIIEPNGTAVPQPGEDWETSLQEFFDAEGEGIDALAEASAEPGFFLPMCDFQVALVLSQSGAQAGIAWYNVPDDPTAVPAAIYGIVPDDAAVGQVISSGDIRNHPEYAGGNIGFALTKNDLAVYYSEYQRNAFCSACVSPGHWIMTLIYRSRIDVNTYYLAFEDWEGANASDWSGNDGDFNDKVFRVTGVTCVGSGVPCDTGELGVCAGGLLECLPGGELTCRQRIMPTAELCDNFDNDCNGLVDDGDGLCPVGEVCDQGVCRPTCSGGEFPCPTPLQCHPTTGLCVEVACLDVTCPVGTVCRGGACVGACDGVVCPLGQECQLGRCVDRCTNVQCGVGDVCEQGVCVISCACRGCPLGQSCSASGHCVDSGCETLVCAAGEQCVAGACVDACAGASCPGGASCVAGECGEPLPGGGGGTMGTGGDGNPSTVDPAGQGGAAGSATISAGATADAPGTNGGVRTPTEPSCGCRFARPSGNAWLWVSGLWIALGWQVRRRQRAAARRARSGGAPAHE